MVLSSHLLPDITAVLVAPLTNLKPTTLVTLDVAVTFNDAVFVLLTLDMAAIASRRLSRKMGDLLDYEFDIRRAVERLLTGF